MNSMAHEVITKSKYQSLRNKYDKREKAYQKYFKITGRNWIDEENEKKYNIPKGTTNDETSAIEVYEFKNQKNKGRYNGYMKSDKKEITTWNGEKLADITYLGNEYSIGLGKRQNFRAKGIDGRNWSGTHFVSSGDYVNMKVTK